MENKLRCYIKKINLIKICWRILRGLKFLILLEMCFIDTLFYVPNTLHFNLRSSNLNILWCSFLFLHIDVYMLSILGDSPSMLSAHGSPLLCFHLTMNLFKFRFWNF